jgi:hypothetical protein
MAEMAEWEIVKIVGSESEASIVIGFLQSSGIEAQAESLHSSELPTEIGELASVNIRVPPEQADDARAALNSREDVATGDEGAMSGEPVADAGDVGDAAYVDDTPGIGLAPDPSLDPGPPGPAPSLPLPGEEPVER